MKREMIGPLVIAGLATALAVVSVLVWLSRGNKQLIRRKLRLGGLLLFWTGALSGCGDEQVMCYDPVCYAGGGGAPPQTGTVTMDEAIGGTIDLDLTATTLLHGTVADLSGRYLSFAVVDGSDAIVQNQSLSAVDGAFDEPSETFDMNIDSSLEAGTYELKFYAAPSSGSPSDADLLDGQYVLNITR